MSKNAKQFAMSFDGDNRFASSMLKGKFQYYLEYDSPLSCQSFNASLALTKDFAEEVGKEERLFAWTLSDRLLDEHCHDPVLFAEALNKSSKKPVIMTISGRNSDSDRIKTLLAEAYEKGLRNFLACSGHLIEQDFSGNKRYFDSVATLGIAADFGKELRIGAVVNPFKYTAEDQLLQYAKMLCKVNNGASFLITQAGWDMKKAQELQWFLQKNNLTLPLIARVCYINFEEAEKLAEGYRPGVFLPVPMGCLFQQDASKTAEEYQEKQLFRLALQIVAHHRLGYSAIQIAGLHSASLLKKLFDKIDELEKELPDYNSWLAEWQKQFGDLNLSATQNPHYLYSGLLQKDQLDFNPEEYPVKGSELPKAAKLDMIKYQIGKLLHKSNKKSKFWELMRYISRLPIEKLDYLQNCFYLNNSPCPKKMHFGPCGDSFPNGRCENNLQQCFFHRVAHIAAETNNYHILEGNRE